MVLSDYIPVITLGILAALFVISILQLSSVKKSMRTQNEQQIYARIMESRIKIEDTDVFTKMAKESSYFTEHFTLVDNPQEYYTIMAYIDLFEFLFHLKRTDMIDDDLWYRWNGLIRNLMTIPKFKKVWDKTKNNHRQRFISFIDGV